MPTIKQDQEMLQEIRDYIEALKRVRDLTDSLPYNVPEVLTEILNKYEGNNAT